MFEAALPGDFAVADPTQSAPVRDVRADRILILNEVAKFAEALKNTVKTAHIDRISEEETTVRCEGDIAEARISFQVPTSIDPSKFLKLLEEEKITRKQFLACIKVSITEAKEVAHPADIQRMTVVGDGKYSINVTRKKDTNFDLQGTIDAAYETLAKTPIRKAKPA